jgi:F-type H+-transporting ATPase subunit b
LEGLGINLGYLLVQIFNFLIILIILVGWMYKPVLNMLQKRREKIAQGLEDARVAADARANAEKEAEKIMDDARHKAAKLVREASERAGKTALEIKTEAERQAMHIREVAHEESEEAKIKVLHDLRGQVASLAIAAAQKVIGETLDEKRQHALIEDFFSGVRDGKVVLLEGEKLTGASAEVTSALPLTKKEKELVEREVKAKLGSDAKVDFQVETDILGGLVIRVGDKVLDGSVAGKLESLHQSLE